MILFPPAKVNIGLNVLGKRQDGFHEIESVMTPIPLTDVLEIIPSDEFEFKVSGIDIAGKAEDNLCVRAYQLMRERYNVAPVYIHLIKKIPMGAGLGGGSSDAAFVLSGINNLFNLGCSEDDLREMAAILGSDCPFFISNSSQFATGRGEILRPIQLDLDSYWIKVINPGIHISTQEAYRDVLINPMSDLEQLIKRPLDEWKDRVKNSFEQSVFQAHPAIAKLKAMLYEEGALYASMSGSGSTVFGLFRDRPEKNPNYAHQWVMQLNA